MPAELYKISVDNHAERTEEYTLGSGTICLAGAQQMVVAHSVVIRGFWDEDGEICLIQLDLTAERDQLRILRQFRIVPQTVPVEMGVHVKLRFELDSARVPDEVLSELGRGRDLVDLADTKDDFPALLNLLYYDLQKIEISEPL